jgi:hypothetical protein
MRPTLRGALSLGLGFGGIILFGIALSRVLDTGSCASGGPYVSVRPCPDGTGLLFVLLAGGLIVWMAGLVLSKGGLAQPGTGQILWTAGFAGGGVALLLKTLTQESLGPDAKLGALIVAAVFIPMGLAVGITGLVQLSRRPHPGPKRRRSGVPAVRSTDPSKQLQRLRSIGALTRAEFDQLKLEPSAERLARIQLLAEGKASGVLTVQEFEAKKQAAIRGDLD